MTAPQSKPRRTRWRRRIAQFVVTLAILFAVAWFFRGPIVGTLIKRAVASNLNATAQAGSVTLSAGGGTLIIEDFAIRANGIANDGGQVLSIDKVAVELSPQDFLFGRGGVREVSLIGPVLRISQSTADGKVNLGGMLKQRTNPLDKPASTQAPDSLPRMVVSGGVIELGEYDAGRYAPLKRIHVEGLVEQTVGAPGESVITFRQVASDDSTAGLLDISGRYSSTGLSLVMGDLALADLKAESLPTPIRATVARLGMQGRIQHSEFRYGFDGGFSASFELDDVSMSLPLTPQPIEDNEGNIIPLTPEEAERPLRMTGVAGTVKFSEKGWNGTITGFAEELPYEVAIDWRGTSIDSPFDITLISHGYNLKDVPAALKYAPGVTQLRFQQFGNPTAIVDSEVRVSRSDPTQDGPADVHSSGRVLLRNGSAAFHKFPYRFYNLTGEITFDAAGIRIVHLEGDAPNGATVNASGTLMPPHNPAGDIDVVVKGLPVNDKLREAMKSRGSIMDALFSERQYERLLSLGLIRKPGTTGDAPEFELGGSADVTVKVLRYPLPNGEGDWHDHIAVAFNRAQLLPEAFPYPLTGSGFVINKDNTIATVKTATFKGLFGGEAKLAARVDLEKLEEPGAEFVPDLEVSATKIPVSPLLLAALPPAKEAMGDGRTLGELLSELNLSGKGDGEVRLSMDDQGRSVYDIEVSLGGLSARPNPRTPNAQQLELSDVKGTVKVSRTHLATSLSADVRILNDPNVPGGVAPAGEVSITLATPIRAEIPDPLNLKIDAAGLLLHAPIEDVAAVFSPSTAEVLMRLRAEHLPSGPVDGSLSMTLPDEGHGSIDVLVKPRAKAALTLAGSRAELSKPTGEIGVRFDARSAAATSGGSWVDFSGFHSELAAGGSVALDGRWWIAESATAPAGKPLTATITAARFEDPLVRAIAIDAAGSESFAQTLREYNPSGLFDATVIGGNTNASPVVTIVPSSLAITSNAVRVAFASATGSVVVQSGGGRLNALALTAADWSGAIDGGWLMQTDGTVAVNAKLSIASAGVPVGLHALFPPALRETMTDLEVGVSGPLTVENAQLAWTFDGQGKTRGVSFDGPIMFEGLKTDVGAEVTDAKGRADVVFSSQGDQPSTFDVRIGGPSARASGVSLTDFRTRITSGINGEIIVPVIVADAHGGRVSGDAVVRALFVNPDGSTGPRQFETTVTASGIRFGSLLADLSAKPQTPDNDVPLDDSRGQLDANVSLKGNSGDIESRRGRGTITIGGGKVLSIPLVVPLVRVANFQLPRDEGLNFAMVEFFIDGSVISVEQLAIESESVGLYGYGTALWPSQELDLRIRSRSRSRIPIVSDVLETLRGEIVTAVARGTISNPSVSVSTFAGTTKFLGRVLGQEPSEQQKRLEQIERRHRGTSVAPLRDQPADLVDASPTPDDR